MKQFVWLILVAASLAAQTQQTNTEDHQAMQGAMAPKSCPFHAQHMNAQATSEDQRFAEMNERGARAMGFDQTKNNHHFRTLDGGGAIEVTVNDPSDAANLAAIRRHFSKIAREFALGNFTAPFMTHAGMPPGAETMQKLKSKISYRYEELPQGARVRISTADSEALHAVHEFFAYQIREHRTGDLDHQQ